MYKTKILINDHTLLLEQHTSILAMNGMIYTSLSALMHAPISNEFR